MKRKVVVQLLFFFFLNDPPPPKFSPLPLPAPLPSCQRPARSLPADPVYRDWIALFAGDGYDELVAASTDLLDSSCTRRDRVATADAFDRSTRYEIAFWQMAYTRGGEKG